MRIVPVEQAHEVVLQNEEQLEHRSHEPRLTTEQEMRAERYVDALPMEAMLAQSLHQVFVAENLLLDGLRLLTEREAVAYLEVVDDADVGIGRGFLHVEFFQFLLRLAELQKQTPFASINFLQSCFEVGMKLLRGRLHITDVAIATVWSNRNPVYQVKYLQTEEVVFPKTHRLVKAEGVATQEVCTEYLVPWLQEHKHIKQEIAVFQQDAILVSRQIVFAPHVLTFIVFLEATDA